MVIDQILQYHKLPPAPWGVSGPATILDPDNVTLMVTSPSHEESERRIQNKELPFTCIRVCSLEPCHYLSQDQVEEVAKFIALSRNAHDVMIRRGWYPVAIRNKLDHVIGWIVEGKGLHKFRLPDDILCLDDPYTALVEVDKWYKEHCENTSDEVK